MSRVSELEAWLPDERTGALITSPLTVRYLCGNVPENAIVLLFKEEALLFVSEREVSRLSGKIPDVSVRAVTGGGVMLNELVKYGIKRLLIEPDKMTVEDYVLFGETLHYAEIDTSDTLTEQLSKMRSIKTDDEIALMASAQRICDKCFERLVGGLRKGMTERQIAALLEFYLTDYGSEGIPFPSRVLSGENTIDPRRRPSDRQLADGDFLILEFGAAREGYCARMCRTLAVGQIPDALEEAYHGVSCAISDGLKALRADTGGKVADSVARSTLNAFGLDRRYVGGFAHGVGLEPREDPVLGQGSGTLLRENMTLAVSVGISVNSKDLKYGIKIGDMAAITEEGCVNFTAATKNLIHV